MTKCAYAGMPGGHITVAQQQAAPYMSGQPGAYVESLYNTFQNTLGRKNPFAAYTYLKEHGLDPNAVRLEQTDDIKQLLADEQKRKQFMAGLDTLDDIEYEDAGEGYKGVPFTTFVDKNGQNHRYYIPINEQGDVSPYDMKQMYLYNMHRNAYLHGQRSTRALAQKYVNDHNLGEYAREAEDNSDDYTSFWRENNNQAMQNASDARLYHNAAVALSGQDAPSKDDVFRNIDWIRQAMEDPSSVVNIGGVDVPVKAVVDGYRRKFESIKDPKVLSKMEDEDQRFIEDFENNRYAAENENLAAWREAFPELQQTHDMYTRRPTRGEQGMPWGVIGAIDQFIHRNEQLPSQEELSVLQGSPFGDKIRSGHGTMSNALQRWEEYGGQAADKWAEDAPLYMLGIPQLGNFLGNGTIRAAAGLYDWSNNQPERWRMAKQLGGSYFNNSPMTSLFTSSRTGQDNGAMNSYGISPALDSASIFLNAKGGGNALKGLVGYAGRSANKTGRLLNMGGTPLQKGKRVGMQYFRDYIPRYRKPLTNPFTEFPTNFRKGTWQYTKWGGNRLFNSVWNFPAAAPYKWMGGAGLYVPFQNTIRDTAKGVSTLNDIYNHDVNAVHSPVNQGITRSTQTSAAGE